MSDYPNFGVSVAFERIRNDPPADNFPGEFLTFYFRRQPLNPAVPTISVYNCNGSASRVEGAEDKKEQQKYLSDSLSREVNVSAQNRKPRVRTLVEPDIPDHIAKG